MMKLRRIYSNNVIRVVFFMLILTLIVIQSSAESYTIYVKPAPRQASTSFNYVFNFTTDSSCNNVLLSNKTTITTDSEGIGYVILNISSLTQDPKYLCEYRNGALRRVHSDLPTLLPASKFALNVSNQTLNNKISTVNTSLNSKDNWINSSGDRVAGNFNYSNKGNITNVNKGVITNLWASFVGGINSVIHFLSDIELSGHKIYNASQINSTVFYQSGKIVLTTSDNTTLTNRITGLATSNVSNTNAVSALRTSNATLYARELSDNSTQNTALNTKLNSSANTANPIIRGSLNLTKNVTLDTINIMNRTGQIKSKIYYDEVDNRLVIQVTG